MRRPRVRRSIAAVRSLPRESTVAATERLSAVTHLLSSLEHLVRENEQAKGGFNNWNITKRNFPGRTRLVRRAADVVADRRVTRVLHVARVVAAASLLLPGKRRGGTTTHRRLLAANGVLAGTSLVLHPRHHYGTDGADQGSFLVQTAATVARASSGHPQVVDAAMWYVALQGVLSYTASGWVKVASDTWRRGDAVPGVMRTQSFGDPHTWAFVNRHPFAARVLGHGALAMECVFPLVFVGRKRFGPLLLVTAATFHVANARIMGLPRFVWSFVSMHPAVLYAIGPRTRTSADGQTQRRDDALPLASAALAAGGLAAGLVSQARRRSTIARGFGDERTMTTVSGNTLAFRVHGSSADGAGARPTVIFENGLGTTAEQWEWIVSELALHLPAVTYHRAGYGRSTYTGRSTFSLDGAADDLADLVQHVAQDRPAIVVGHSLGGYLAVKASRKRRGLVEALALLDSSHPGEMQRSSQQADGQRVLANNLRLLPASLKLGLGWMLERPEWLEALPPHVQEMALAQYRDDRTWASAQREWQAVETEFGGYAGRKLEIDVPVLTITAGQTAAKDPVQKELHDELADAAPWARRHVVDGVGHQQLLWDEMAAHEVARLLVSFVDDVEHEGATDVLGGGLR